MDNKMNYLLCTYAGISVTDALIKTLKLNSIYFKAKKSATKLKYKKGLMGISKETKKLPRIMHIYVIISLYKYSLIPIYCIESTKNIFKREEDFINEYIDLFNYAYEEINNDEEIERTDVAEFLANVYKDFKDYLPDTYKGHKLEDESIRISRKEMIKFLKKNRIILERIPTDDDEYEDYSVMLLDK